MKRIAGAMTRRNVAFALAIWIGLGAFAGSATELWRIADRANYGLPLGLVFALDGLAVVCVIVLSARPDRQALAALVVATLTSIGLQVLSVQREGVPVDRYVSAVLVHALVPLASFVAVHLATRLDRPLARSRVHAGEGAPVHGGVHAGVQEPVHAGLHASGVRVHAGAVQAVQPVGELPVGGAVGGPVLDEVALDRLEAAGLLRAGERDRLVVISEAMREAEGAVTGAEVAALFGKDGSTGRRYLSRYRELAGAVPVG